MDFFEFVIIVVAIAVVGRIVNSYFKCKAAARKARQDDEESAAEHLAQLARLEERIKVLERIVTDEQFDLRQRFRNL
ncbi:MAG TPA: hypothetical protein VF329_08985 [Gammaproteobacteria bacterium]